MTMCARCGAMLRGEQRRFCSLTCYRARPAGLDTARRFWAKVDRRGPTDCWNWTGQTTANGYGVLMVGPHGAQKHRRAHRIALELVGRSVPAGLVTRHSCDNRLCVNPAHLLHGTQADNMRDMVERGRHWKQRP